MRARELRTLWHKSWLETRWGFVAALAILLTFSVWSVLRYPEAVRAGLRDLQLHNHPNAALRGLTNYAQVEIFEKLTILWTIFSVMLGAGGLLKERSLGTAPFLLSLPTSRRRLLAVRCSVSMSQATFLAMAAYAVVPLTFPLVHQSYSFSLALRYALILAASGVAFVVYGILISVVLEGSNWPGIIGATTAFLSLTLGELVTGFHKLAPLPVLSGERYFRYGLVPWTGMSVSLVMASLMLAFALWIVKWQDF
jgi:hypothetical protein